ncbi:unnamed protein product [Rotaria sordida]|uniref:Uncharacterized protein n=1 Tax=Rotaria sordida TaxID=392033 RepID=A0A813VA16_9BILA|nr:unnamed protein product [Rotaria sordida]
MKHDHRMYYHPNRVFVSNEIPVLYEPDFGFLKLGVYSTLKEITRQLTTFIYIHELKYVIKININHHFFYALKHIFGIQLNNVFHY